MLHRAVKGSVSRYQSYAHAALHARVCRTPAQPAAQAITSAITSAYNLATKTLKGRLIAPYQREGVSWLLWRELIETGPKGGFLCDEMGLGKTVQIISTILGNPGKRTLIVVPKSIVTQW